MFFHPSHNIDEMSLFKYVCWVGGGEGQKWSKRGVSFFFVIIHLEVMKESAHRYSFFFLSYIDFCFFQLCIMIHHFFFFLYNNGISFTIILVDVEVRTLNVMWQYIEIGAPACPHHRTLSTSCGSQLGYLHLCGSGVRIGATLTKAVAASAYNVCRHAGAGQM